MQSKVKCRDCRYCGTRKSDNNGTNYNDCNHPHMSGTFLISDLSYPCRKFSIKVPKCIKLWEQKLNG